MGFYTKKDIYGDEIMISIRREFTPHINENDCWNLTLAVATGIDYKDIRRELFKKKVINNSGVLIASYDNAVLRAFGYVPVHPIDIPLKATVADILRKFHDRKVIIASITVRDGKYIPHLSYGYNGVDHTTSDDDSSMFDEVTKVWINTQKLHPSL